MQRRSAVRHWSQEANAAPGIRKSPRPLPLLLEHTHACGTSVNRYREIEVVGSPRDMSRQIGKAAGDEIRGFCDVALSGEYCCTRRIASATTSSAAARATRIVFVDQGHDGRN